MKRTAILFVLLAAMAAGARAQSKYITVEYKDGTKKTYETQQGVHTSLFRSSGNGTWDYGYRYYTNGKGGSRVEHFVSLGGLSTIKEVRRGINEFNAYCDLVAMRDGKRQYLNSWQYVYEGDEEQLLVWDDYEEEGVDWHESNGWVEWDWDSSVSDSQIVSIKPRKAGEWYTKVKFLKPASVVYIYAKDEKGGVLQAGYTVSAREFPASTAIYDDDSRTTNAKEVILGEQQYVDFYLGDPDPLSQSDVSWVQWLSDDERVATVEKTPEGIGAQKYIHARATIKGSGVAYITAQSPSGAASVDIALTVHPGVPVTAKYFPDATFRSYVSTNFDKNQDGYLSKAERNAVGKIDVSGTSASPGSIASLKGIEYFPNMDILFCSYNKLTSLDVSKNTELRYFSCDRNQLTALDVSKNTILQYFFCNFNQLTSLDVSKNKALVQFYCNNNQLTSLDVSSHTRLTDLYCNDNRLTSLDVSKCSRLTTLNCRSNQLTTLDLSTATAQNIAVQLGEKTTYSTYYKYDCETADGAHWYLYVDKSVTIKKEALNL